MAGEAVQAIGLVAQARVRWLADLDVSGAMPERIVVVRNEATAHAWRREIIESRSDLLIGTRFVTPISLAAEVVELAGIAFALGEEAVRAARINSLIARNLPLGSLDLDVLKRGRGWGTALASTISELESAGLDAAMLRAEQDPRARDLGRILDALDVEAGSSWTIARLLREATLCLNRDPSLWPYSGHTLIEVTGHETAVMAGWLTAIPRNRIVSIATQPRRTAYVDRVRDRYGEFALHEIDALTSNELGLLSKYLFSSPDVLAAADRARSPGNDGTLQFEEHAGLEEELDAAVTWVLGEIGDCGTSLEQIGIVVPSADPYAGLLTARLEALLPDSVCVLGGLPALGTSAGARIATLLRAFDSYLHIDAMAELLPILELTHDTFPLSRRDAIATLYELGTVGGSAARPEGAFDWVERSTLRRNALVALIDEARRAEASEREVRSLERRRETLEAIAAPLASIERVARAIVGGASLKVIWPALEVLVTRHLRLGDDGDRIAAALGNTLRQLIDAEILTGIQALGAIANALEAIRLPRGRFGEARITIGALADIVGLTFRCVRILGLAEGTIPSTVREDPVLSDASRRALDRRIPLATERVVSQLHALHRVVLGATERLVLSVARMDPRRSYREPSGVLLEAAAAVGRPPLGTNGLTIPDLRILRQQGFDPARHELRTVRARWPVHAPGQLERAVRRRQVPRKWRTDVAIAIDRLLEPRSDVAGPNDGWFPDGKFPLLPGLTSKRPISASAMSRLLECPHRFLFERVLGWEAPSEIATEGSIDALSYGTLFHATAESFYRAHGTAFCAKSRSLVEWRPIADAIAEEHFLAFIETFPLAGEEIRSAARRRLQRDLRALLAADWQTAKTFVDVERAFGPLELPLADSSVFVHGAIDRIDTVGAATLVRDLKTGRAKRRKAKDDLRPSYDIQLGLYGLVTAANATAWNLPATVVGSYVYPSDPSGDDRDFIDDFDVLRENTLTWIESGRSLLASRTFPRTPNTEDCAFCSFKPVCGRDAAVRADALLGAAGPAVAGFIRLKVGADDE